MLQLTHHSIVICVACELSGSGKIKEWEAIKKADTSDILTETILLMSSVIYVAKHILDQKSVLLPCFPDVCDVQTKKDIDSFLDVENCNTQFSSCWFLKQLITHLNCYMLHKCILKKFGNVLYHDRVIYCILIALSWALSASQSSNHMLLI